MLCKYTSSVAEYQRVRARKPRIESRSSTGTWLHLRNHLGFGKHAAKSTLADANTKRDYRIFEEFAYKVIAEAQRFRIVDIFDRGYNDFRRLHNIESIGAYFVIRGKTNNDFKPMKWKRRFPPESGILSDAVGYMAGQLTMEKYPDKIRRVIYLDKESKKKFIFFTNALTISPVMVAELYHNRWQIELFFYDKHIIMQSWRQSYVDSQRITHVTSRFNFT